MPSRSKPIATAFSALSFGLLGWVAAHLIKDFAHVLGDSMVLVHYRPDLTPDQLDNLRGFVTSEDGQGVLGGPEPGQTAAFKAVNKRDTMVCNEFNLTPLITFKNNWFKDPAASNP